MKILLELADKKIELLKEVFEVDKEIVNICSAYTEKEFKEISENILIVEKHNEVMKIIEDIVDLEVRTNLN